MLLVEVDGKGNLTALFEHAPVGFEPREIHPGISAMQMDTEASLREYLKVQARVPVIGRIGPLARAFDFVATAAPGVKEILTIGKVCWELRESIEGRADWDLIVVDAAATGHVISQLDAPAGHPGAGGGRPDPPADRLDDRAARRSAAHRPQRGHVAGGDAGRTRRSSSWRGPRRSSTSPLGAVIVNRVLPELFTRGRRGDVRRASLTRQRPRCSNGAPGDGSRRGARRGRLAVSMRRSRSSHLARAARRGRPRRCCSCRTCSCATTGCASPTWSPTRSARSSTVSDAASRSQRSSRRREVVVFCGSGGVGKTSIAAAAARHRRRAARRQGARAHHRSGAAAGRRARARGGRQRRRAACRSTRTRSSASSRAASCGRRCSTPSGRGTSWCCATRPTRRPRTASSTTGCTTTSPAASCRATTTSRWSGSTTCTPAASYDLIVVDTPPTRNAIDFLEAPARMADFFGGRLLRWLTMPYRIGGGRGAGCSTPRASPSTRWPTACSAASSSRTSPSSSSTSSRCTTGFVERADAVEQLLHDRRTTFAVVTTLEGAPLREAEIFCGELTARDFHLGALVLNKTLPEYLLSTDGEPRRDVFDPRAPSGRRASSPPPDSTRSPTPLDRRGCCARSANRSATTRWWPAARPSCAPSSRIAPPVRRGRQRARLRHRHHRRRRAGPHRRALFASGGAGYAIAP